MPEDVPLVSVVIPTYHRPGFLAEAVESVAAQTYEPMEVLVVDGDPNPANRALVEDRADEFASVEYVAQTDSAGAAAARNLGIERASGEFIAFLDDDDRWEQTKVEQQVEVCLDGRDEGVGVVYTGMRFEDRMEAGRADFRPEISGDVTRELLCGNFIGSFSRLLVAADVVEAAGLIDERFDVWEDWEWYVRLSQHCSFRAIDDPLTVRRGGHGQDQLSHDVRRTYEESYPLFVDTCGPLAARYGRVFLRRFHGCVNYRLGWAALMRGNYAIARRALARAVYWYPVSPRFLAVFALALGGPTVRRLYGALPDPVTSRAGRWLRRWT